MKKVINIEKYGTYSTRELAEVLVREWMFESVVEKKDFLLIRQAKIDTIMQILNEWVTQHVNQKEKS